MDISFIHTGDVHIGQAFSNMRFGTKFAKLRRQEILDTFNNIIELAKKKEVNFLFIAGDLFEEDLITFKDLQFIESRFRSINQIEIIIIAGNHDPIIDNKSSYKMINWSSNVHVLSNTLTKLEFLQYDTTIWGFSWNTKMIKDPILDEIKIESNTTNNILVAHGDIYNESVYLPIHKDKLIEKGFSYIALGHIHKPEFIANNIAYCGSPEPLDFGETGEHGVILGTLKSDKFKNEFKFIPLCKRHIIKSTLTIDEDDDLYQIVDKIKLVATNKFDIYKIIIQGIKSEYLDIDLIQTKLSEEYDFIEVIDKTKDDIDIEQLQKDNEDNLIGQYIKQMKTKDLNNEIVKKALKYGLEALQKDKGV